MRFEPGPGACDGARDVLVFYLPPGPHVFDYQVIVVNLPNKEVITCGPSAFLRGVDEPEAVVALYTERLTAVQYLVGYVSFLVYFCDWHV